MSIFILTASIVLLLVLITVFKLNAFLSLIISTLLVGIAKGMPFAELLTTMQKGIGTTLGGLLLIVGFGVMLGCLLSESGAAQRISSVLIQLFGVKYAKLAMLITGFVVGIAMFYNAGFVILIPMVFSVAINTKQPIIYIGIATASALSVTHGFLPPHPGPTTIAVVFKADMGKTLLYGLVVAIPALFCAGFIFPEFLKKIVANPPEGLMQKKHFAEHEMPSFALSFATALIPVVLMGLATATELTLPADSSLRHNLKFLGDPSISMLLTVLFSLVMLGIARGVSMPELMDKTGAAVSSAAMIIMIIAAGGAFKQVLTDSGIGKDIAAMFTGSTLSPLFLGWLIATIIRIALGSATIAGLTAAGIVQPMIASTGASPELMVLSIGAGSLMCSHVNDTGFWMFKEYFGISVKDTFKTWSVMETIVGVVGLFGVLVLEALGV